MKIKTINAADVQRALGAILNEWAGLMDTPHLSILHGEEINRDENACPWIGVYCIGSDFPPRTTGFGVGMRYQHIRFMVVCQHTSANSGAECTARLEDLVQKVTSAVLSDPSLKGTVNALDSFAVRYPEWGKSNGIYIQTAAVEFTAVATTDVTES